ncbi:MAG: hypothetical protein IJJ52_01380 [Lachnospiraceae bacterium]|nr:hypothetical protein [Lachnospiraceae bacterium]
MRSRIFKLICLTLLFIGGVAFFSNLSLLNRGQSVSASDLTDPTLPVVCIDVDGNKVNRMNGYVTEMDVRNMRGGLIPVTTTRTIRVSYKAYHNKVRSVSYEVSTPDTGEVVENAKIGNFQADGDYMSATFSLSEPILMNREYPIRFTVTTESKDVYYYARVIQRSDPITNLYVQFVYDFYEGCTNQAGASDLNTYLETDDTITNNSFTNVNIKSTLRQVTWGNLNPQIYRKAVPTIRDMSGETCSLTTDYMISAESDSGQEIYHVREFYRLRYYNSRMMLLNFTRKALQVYNGHSETAITASGVNLGIADNDVQYVANAAADTVAFVQDGALWEYAASSDKLARVFSFREAGVGTDERDDNTDYGIKIVRVSEGGGIDFAVYGYMSRGEHEGRSGVAICHYNSESSTVTERSFIPYMKSFDLLEKDMEKLCYIGTENLAYLYLDRAVYSVDLSSRNAEQILHGIHPDCFVSSASHSRIAWMNAMDPYASSEITVMDLETGARRAIRSDSGQFLRTIGFLNDDLVYGIAEESDLVSGISGDVTFPMKKLLIEDGNGTVVKDYNPQGMWVTDVSMEPGLARLTRVKKEGGVYVPAEGDNIINNRQAEESEVTVSLASSARQGVQVGLKFPRSVASLKPSITDFRIRYLPQQVFVPEAVEDGLHLYYVYAYGRLMQIFTDPARAVLTADENVGVVLNEKGQYIYERGNKQTKTELANADIPEAFLSGMIDANDLAEAVPENVTVLNLTGCTLDQVLYQLSQGRAVVTRLGDGSIRVIVGYDRYNTLQYNFDTTEHFYMGINDSTNAMLEGGNVFVTYIESRSTVKETRS